jgi:hypothetical protein
VKNVEEKCIQSIMKKYMVTSISYRVFSDLDRMKRTGRGLPGFSYLVKDANIIVEIVSDYY